MSRTERLLDLLQSLRRRKYAVSGRVLAKELEVSLRTLYRDITTLKSIGAPIEGEAGMGFVLRPGYTLPPLMFSAEEIEATVLGIRWVIERGDNRLVLAARNALSKIGAVVPPKLKEDLETGTLLVPTQIRPNVDSALVECVRGAIRNGTKLKLSYRDQKDQLSERVVWPFALAFYDQVLIVMTWCETRRDFRHFRADRIASWVDIKARYPRHRLDLLREWQAKEGIPSDKYDL
jgi:predicted DNA-binding transcriptional regulator YafY